MAPTSVPRTTAPRSPTGCSTRSATGVSGGSGRLVDAASPAHAQHARRCRCLPEPIVLGWKAVNHSGGTMTDVHHARTTRRGLLAGTGAVAGATALGRLGGQRPTQEIEEVAGWPPTTGRRGPGSVASGRSAPDRELRRLARRGQQRPHPGQCQPAGGVRHPAHPVRARPTRCGASGRPGTGSSPSCGGCAATSGGRMGVELQSFVQPAGARNRGERITNVVATLRGTARPSASTWSRGTTTRGSPT